MTQRTYLSIMMCLIFLFTFVACGSPSESPNTDSQSETSGISETTVDDDSNVSDTDAEESGTEEITEEPSASDDDIGAESEEIESDDSASGGASPGDNEDTIQNVSNSIDLDAQYSLDDENPFDSEGIMEQLRYSLGGGGEDTRYHYYGCVLIDDPSIAGSNPPASDSRALYPGLGSQGCICGIKEGNNVEVVLEDPNGIPIYSDTFQAELGDSVERASSVYYADGTTGESNNCYQVEYDFILVPGDPFGIYQKTVTIGEHTFVDEFLRSEPAHPTQYYAPRLNGYVLEGFDSMEEVTVLFYVPLYAGGIYEGELFQAASIKLDENGSALILSDNPDLDLRTVRGKPTDANFEVWVGHGILSADPLQSPFDWELLIAENPDNPFVYYYSGQVDRALEADSDFLLARFDRALGILGHWDFPGLIERNSVRHLFWVNEEGNSEVRILAYNSINDDKLDTGIEDLTEVLALVPENVIAYLARGLIFAIQGNPDEALADFNEAINLEPNLLLGYTLKAEVEFHLSKQPEKARETINQAYLELANDPESLAADDLASLATTFGDIQLAIDLYSQAIDREDRDNFIKSYLFNRGILYQQLGDYDKANIDLQNSQLLATSMTFIPEGEFFMGTNATDFGTEAAEQPQHTIYVDPFYIDRVETTVVSYKICIQAGVCGGNPSSEPSDGAVTNVSWGDAKTYCEWLGKRLPTEAEWEKASRGDDQRLYPWGNEVEKLDSCEVNYNDDNDGVAYNNQLFLNDDSCFGPYGLNHAVGNVWEWTADYYDEAYYSNSPPENPQGPDSGEERVLRGGGWSTNNPDFLRVTNRWSRPEDFTRDDVGFRCAMNADE